MTEMEKILLKRISSLEQKLIDIENRLLTIELTTPIVNSTPHTWNVPQWAVPKVTCKDTN